MSDDTEKLQRTVGALREAIDILERATVIVGAVEPGGIEDMFQEAWVRFLERAGRYEAEAGHDAEREAVRAAVEPLARRVLGIEISIDDLWRDYQAELAAGSPDAFRKVVGRVVAAVGPARRQRRALQLIAKELEGHAPDVSRIWKILSEAGATPPREEAPTPRMSATAVQAALVPGRTPEGDINNCALAFFEETDHEEVKRCQLCNGTCPDLERLKKLGRVR